MPSLSIKRTNWFVNTRSCNEGVGRGEVTVPTPRRVVANRVDTDAHLLVSVTEPGAVTIPPPASSFLCAFFLAFWSWWWKGGYWFFLTRLCKRILRCEFGCVLMITIFPLFRQAVSLLSKPISPIWLSYFYLFLLLLFPSYSCVYSSASLLSSPAFILCLIILPDP